MECHHIHCTFCKHAIFCASGGIDALSLSCCCFAAPQGELDGCEKLTGKSFQHLNLRGCKNLTHRAFEDVKSLVGLQHLELRGCKELTNAALE
jgi:hypothetical protein